MPFKKYAQRDALIQTGLATSSEIELRRSEYRISIDLPDGTLIAEPGKGTRFEVLERIRALIEETNFNPFESASPQIFQNVHQIRFDIQVWHGNLTFSARNTTVDRLFFTE